MRKITMAVVVFGLIAGLVQPVAATTTDQAEFIRKQQQLEQEARNQRALSEYQRARESYMQVRQQLDQERQAVKMELLQRSKDFILQINNAAIKYLESKKNKLQSTQHIPKEKLSKILVELDDRIRKLEAVKGEIEGAGSVGELRSIVKTLRTHWREARGALKRVAGLTLIEKNSAMISRGEKLSGTISSQISGLKDQGRDVSNLEKLNSDLKNSLAVAEEKNDDARSKFETIESSENANKAFRNGMRLVKESHKEIKMAHAILIDINKELKGMVERP